MAYTTINKSTDHFNTLLYSGNGSNPRTLTGVGFQPDFVWQKNRTDSNGHTLADAIRGANKTIGSDGNSVEVTDKNDGHLAAFTSDGFTVGAGSSSDARVDDGSHTYVAWNWKGTGSSAVTNSNGSYTSYVIANDTAGFSIVKYTGGSGAGTVGHGLSAAPAVILLKPYNYADNWRVYHHENTSAPETDFLKLQSDAATSDSNDVWNDTAPTSTVFSIGTNGGISGSYNFIAYCFTEKTGYSKFGSYTANNNADGPFIYTGFKPAWVMVKKYSNTNHWIIWDNKRSTNNGANIINKKLYANLSNAENGADDISFLSNGFKFHTNTGDWNESESYIYMAFAEAPLVGSNNIPCTAR